MREMVGTWRKLSKEAGLSRYPATLTILPNGQYRGAAEMPGEYAYWDVGTWTEDGLGAVTLSTANDARVKYRVSLDGDRLTFVSPDGERIVYGQE
jgi:hypothetical protein